MEPEEEPCGAAVREVFEEVNNLKNSFCSDITRTEPRPQSEVILCGHKMSTG